MPTCPVGQVIYEAFTRLGLGRAEVIRLLNAQAKAVGEKGVNYNRTALSRWLTGTIPLPAAQRLIISVLGIPLAKFTEAVHAQESARRQADFRNIAAAEADEAVSVDEQLDTENVNTLTAWLIDTNATDDTIEQIERASISLAEAHANVPATRVLAEALRVHRWTQVILRSGKQRPRQTRDLLRVDSDLLAHVCMLLGDLGRNDRAAQYGIAAQLYAHEAAVNEAIAWSVRAKTARWQRRYVEAADMARRGFEISHPTSTRIELAYREAHAAARLGHTSRAQEALRRAGKAAETVPVNDTNMSVWSFSTPRQALFAMSVAIHSGEPDAALRAVEMADAAWASGVPRVPATWAQVRAGAGIAYLMKGALDGTVEQMVHVFDLPRGLRIDTVIAYLNDLDHRLEETRFANDRIAADLRERIRTFQLTTALSDETIENA